MSDCWESVDFFVFHKTVCRWWITQYAVSCAICCRCFSYYAHIKWQSPHHETYAHLKPEEAHSMFPRNTNKHPSGPHGVKIQNTVKRIFTVFWTLHYLHYSEDNLHCSVNLKSYKHWRNFVQTEQKKLYALEVWRKNWCQCSPIRKTVFLTKQCSASESSLLI